MSRPLPPPPNLSPAAASRPRAGARRAWLALLALVAAPAWGVTTGALQDQTCAGFRNGGAMTCASKEFTVTPVFSAAPGTAPFCVAGQEFRFVVDVALSGSNADRYDIAFFVGQQGNDPTAATAGNLCSVATFPTSPAPWSNFDSDSCGDYAARGNSTNTINQIKVVCTPDSAGALQIPYALTYLQNGGAACTGPADVTVESPKCNTGLASVSGAVAVFTGAYVDVTKQTAPDGDSQPFSFTATGPAGSKVIALSGATLTPTSAIGGTYSPATIAAATNAATATLKDGETVRFYINALAAAQTLTITEAATTNWEPAAAISCAPVTGAPTLTTNNASRTIAAALDATNSAAACTVTNTKRARVTLAKSVGGRVAASDQFTVSAAGGGTLTGTTSATTSGTGTGASTVFYSTPAAALTLTDAKAAGTTPLAEYDSRLTCSNAFTGPGATPAASLPINLAATSAALTPAPGDDLNCTFTNTPKPRISLQKAIAAVGGGRVAATDQFTLAITGATPVTTIGSGSIVSSVPASLVGTAGVPLTLSESAAGTASLANYASAYSCTNTGNGGTTVAPGNGTSFGFTPANNDVIACTFTNTRKSASLRLAKTWLNAIVNDAVQLSASGLNSRGFASVANTASETDTDAGTMTVYAGESVTLAEAFTTGAAANYAKALTCTGTSGTLAYTANSLSGTLSVGGSDTLITCTYSNARGMPSLTFLKSVQVTSDPVNAALNPKFIPGADVLYTLTVTNSGPGIVDSGSLVIVDPVPPNTELFTGNLGGGAPFVFADGTLPSGLSCNFVALNNLTDCVDFSTDGVTWTYVPNGSYDPAITHVRFRPSGSMNGDAAPGAPSPSFDLRFRVRLK